MALSPGDKLGPYEVIALLGKGGMGEVYRARDPKLNRDVAIKVLPASLANDADYLTRFQREAQTLAALNHPNIAAIYGLEANAIVMELVEGDLLQGPLALAEALPLARQIAEALEAAHEKGIIHRDLKPGNIKVTPEGVVKVLDFGLAKAVAERATPSGADSPTLTMRATEAGLILGTAGYMSPEQAAGKPVDRRADIWSFGVVLYELLTGKRMFDGETVSHTLASVLKDPIDFAIPQAPPAMQALLKRCLDRNLKHRLKDVGEARIAIEDFLANPQPKEQANPASRPVLLMAISAALLIGLVATISMLWLRPSPSATLASHFSVPAKPGSGVFVSPDGKWLLLSSFEAFYLRPLDSLNWRRVAGTEAATQSSVFWSPDSATFGFVSAGRLRLASLDGSPARDLMEVKNFLGASWRGTRDDGTILVAFDGKLKSIDLRTSRIGDLPLTAKADSPISDPTFLPEGDGFVFIQDRGDGKRLYRSTLNSSAAEPLLLTPYGVQFAKHPATGNWHIFYLAGEPELQSSRILRTAPVDPKTGTLRSTPLRLLQGIATPSGNRISARFSVSGRGVLSWSHLAGTLPIWRLSWTDLTGNLLARVSETRSYVSLALSPDESKIAVQVDDPDPHIWILDSKTGLGGRLSNSPEPESYPHWAPDGRSLFYLSRIAGAFEIRRSFLDNAPKPEVLWRTESPELLSTPILSGISPDGRYLLVQRRRGSLGRLELKSTEPRKLELLEERTTERPEYTWLSPDGRSLVWGTSTLGGGLELQAYPPTAESIKRFVRGSEVIDRPFFSSDGRALYAQLQGNLVMFPLSPDRGIGEPRFLRPWFTTTRRGAVGGVASRDGRRLLLIETDQEQILNPQVITDWTALLPKQP